MYCYKCGTQNPDEAKFCCKCGTNIDQVIGAVSNEAASTNNAESSSIPDMKWFCPDCGNIKHGRGSCDECGTTLEYGIPVIRSAKSKPKQPISHKKIIITVSSGVIALVVVIISLIIGVDWEGVGATVNNTEPAISLELNGRLREVTNFVDGRAAALYTENECDKIAIFDESGKILNTVAIKSSDIPFDPDIIHGGNIRNAAEIVIYGGEDKTCKINWIEEGKNFFYGSVDKPTGGYVLSCGFIIDLDGNNITNLFVNHNQNIDVDLLLASDKPEIIPITEPYNTFNSVESFFSGGISYNNLFGFKDFYGNTLVAPETSDPINSMLIEEYNNGEPGDNIYIVNRFIVCIPTSANGNRYIDIQIKIFDAQNNNKLLAELYSREDYVYIYNFIKDLNYLNGIWYENGNIYIKDAAEGITSINTVTGKATVSTFGHYYECRLYDDVVSISGKLYDRKLNELFVISDKYKWFFATNNGIAYCYGSYESYESFRFRDKSGKIIKKMIYDGHYWDSSKDSGYFILCKNDNIFTYRKKSDFGYNNNHQIYVFDSGKTYTITSKAKEYFHCEGDTVNNAKVVINFDFIRCYYICTLNNGEYLSKSYRYIESFDNGQTYLAEKDDTYEMGYLDSNGKELKFFKDAGCFKENGKYAPVIDDGKMYFINKNMKRISKTFKANSGDYVSTLSDELFEYTSGKKIYLMTTKSAA